MLHAGDVEARVGERQLADERAKHVIRLEPDDARDARGAIPVLDRPTPRRGHDRQGGVGIDRVRRPDAGEQWHVEDAVAAGVAIGQVDRRAPRPTPARRAACPFPRRTLRRGDPCSGRPWSRRRWRSGRRSRWPPRRGRSCRRASSSRAPAGGPRPGRPPDAAGAKGATISLSWATARRPAAWTCSWFQPLATRAAARTRPMENEVLAQAVVDRIEDLVAGERAALREDTLLHEGTIEDLARCPGQQGAVEVDEDGTLRHG